MIAMWSEEHKYKYEYVCVLVAVMRIWWLFRYYHCINKGLKSIQKLYVENDWGPGWSFYDCVIKTVSRIPQLNTTATILTEHAISDSNCRRGSWLVTTNQELRTKKRCTPFKSNLPPKPIEDQNTRWLNLPSFPRPSSQFIYTQTDKLYKFNNMREAPLGVVTQQIHKKHTSRRTHNIPVSDLPPPLNNSTHTP